MGFFQSFQLGKVIGSAVKGFASGGFAGAIAQGGAQALMSTAKAAGAKAQVASSLGTAWSTSVVPSMGNQFQQPSSSFPSASGGGSGILVSNRSDRSVVPTAQITGPVFNLLTRLVDRMGIRVLSANAVVPAARRILSGMVRFAARVPGMSLLGMLASAGLAANEATELVTWFATTKKKHRRIRVTNVKALKRSVRRLEGFRKLAMRVEANLGRRSSRSFARRCRKCRKSPCGC